MRARRKLPLNALLVLALAAGSVSAIARDRAAQAEPTESGSSNSSSSSSSRNNNNSSSSSSGTGMSTGSSRSNRSGNSGDAEKAPADGASKPRRGRSSEKPAAAKPAAAAPAAPKAPAASAIPAAPALGTMTASVDRDAGLLRIHPKGKRDRQDMSVIIGEEFTTDVSLDNNRNIPFDTVRIFLSYEPSTMEPISVNDKSIADAIEGAPTAEVDNSYGTILYEARLKKGVILDDTPILSIQWKSLKVTTGTTVEFSSRDEAYTEVVGNGKDILGNPKTPGDGTLAMTLAILPSDPREAEALLSDPRTYNPRNEKVGGVKLSLVGPAKTPVVGEPFYIDVVLDNRAFSILDNVGLSITYDPAVLEVLDADLDNLITLRTNILDGPFRKTFPWNFQVDNSVYPHRGLIVYRVGTDDLEMTRGKNGPIARIYAVAKKPTAGTNVAFVFAKRAGVKATEVTFLGTDCLGNPDKKADGVNGLTLTVKAAPEGVASKVGADAVAAAK